MEVIIPDTSLSAILGRKLNAVAQLIRNHFPKAERFQHAAQWLWCLGLLLAFCWLYKPEIGQLWEIWLSNDEYSSGLIVPILAAYVIWNRRKELSRIPKKPMPAGLALFFAAQIIRFFGLVFMYDSAQRISFVLSFAALVMFLFGWAFFKKVTPVLLFLILNASDTGIGAHEYNVAFARLGDFFGCFFTGDHGF